MIAQSVVAGIALMFVLPVAAQDAKKGEELAQQQCAACHGKDFVTGLDPTYPKLAGQYQDYLEKVLARLQERRPQEPDHERHREAADARRHSKCGGVSFRAVRDR